MTSDQRSDARLPFADTVTVEVDAQSVVGSGRNVSAQGVYFTTSGNLSVRVRLGADGAVVAGELVRVESMGDGTIGIAVRFRPQ